MWTETFDDSGAAESAVAASDFDFAAGTALRVTETEEFVVVDLTACRADDLEHGRCRAGGHRTCSSTADDA